MSIKISKHFQDFKSQQVKEGTYKRKDNQQKFFLDDRQQNLIN